MRVITLAGSPGFPSRSSALLEYARKQLSKSDIEVYHWHLQNFAPEDLLSARLDSPALLALAEQLSCAAGIIIATPVYKTSFSGGLKALLGLLPEYALDEKVVLPLGSGRAIAHRSALAYTLKPVLNALKAKEILQGVFADDSQVTEYQHKPLFTADLKQRLDGSLSLFLQAIQHQNKGSMPLYSSPVPHITVI